jgi:CRISPR-associated protein Csb2
MRLTFSNPVSGPLLLGQLSHFGYGLFVPDGEIRK